MGKGPSSDAKGAAAVEGQYSKEATRDQIYANRPDQYNAFGSNTWQSENVKDPATGEDTTKWTQRQNLSPEMQGLFSQGIARDKQLGGLSAGMGDRIGQEMGAAPDWNQFGDVHQMDYDPTALRQKAEDDAYGRATSRLDPQFDNDRKQLEIRLRNRGLSSGDQQYESEMDRFSRGRTDAYEQARMGATGEGRAESGQLWQQQLSGNQQSNALRDQQIEEYLGKRGFSLAESNKLAESQRMSELAKDFGGQ